MRPSPGQGTLSSATRARLSRMRRRLSIPPLERYVLTVIFAGAACVALALVSKQERLRDVAHPEVALLAAAVLVGEFVPLKVVRRGVEGEVTTSTTFAFALLLVAGLEPAMLALVGASFLADALRGKQLLKVLFNSCQYALTMMVTGLTLHALTTAAEELRDA